MDEYERYFTPLKLEPQTIHLHFGSTSVRPEKVIYNDPATVVFWSDGTKTVVRCHYGDSYDEREGFLLCCAKKLMGNTGRYNDMMAGLGIPTRHWTDERLDRIATAVLFS